MEQVIWKEQSESTNAEMRRLDVPPWTVLATSDQPGGRGRLGRSWIMPENTMLALSICVPVQQWQVPVSLAPLLVGSALKATLQPMLPVDVKWPNDMLAAAGAHRGRKLVGILCEMLSPDRIIVGSGINLLTPAHLLPVETATSLRAAGGDLSALYSSSEVGTTLDTDGLTSLATPSGREFASALIEQYRNSLHRYTRLARTDPQRLVQQISCDSATLGQRVRVHMSRGDVLEGVAEALEVDGSLRVRDANGQTVSVSAGDVEHLRPSSGTWDW
jgi:BirA family biotin operon repressor/biotin-[acetyl-CoA-carboxylase] ligase